MRRPWTALDGAVCCWIAQARLSFMKRRVGSQALLTDFDELSCWLFDCIRHHALQGWSLQKRCLQRVKHFAEHGQPGHDYLIMLQHHPVYTLGEHRHLG